MKTVARHQHEPADAGRGRCAARFGDAANRKPRGLRFARALFEHVHIRHLRIEKIERRHFLRDVSRELAGVGEAGKTIVRRGARHGDRALG